MPRKPSSTLLRKYAMAATAASFLALRSAPAASLYWDGTGTTWNLNTDWSTSSSAATPDPASFPVSTDIAYFNISTLTSASLTLDANQAATALVFQATDTGGATIAGGSAAPTAGYTLTLGNSGGNVIVMNSGAGAVTIGSTTNGAVSTIVTGAGSLTNNSASLLTLNNSLNDTTAAGVISFAGSGTGGDLVNAIIGTGALTINLTGTGATTTLTGADTYSGATTLTAGTLRLNGAGTLGATTVSIASGATFSVDGTGTGNNITRLNSTNLTFAGGTFRYAGTDQSGSVTNESSVGTLNASSGTSLLTLVNSGGANTSILLNASSLTHTAGATLLVNGVGLGNGAAASSGGAGLVNLTLTTAPTGTSFVGSLNGSSTEAAGTGTYNQKIVPFLLGESTVASGGLGTATGTANTFLTYSTTSGFRPLNPTDEFKDNAIVAGDNTYITAATTMAASTAINSLVLNGGSLSLAAGTTLTNTSGAILFVTNNSIGAPTVTSTLAFGSTLGQISVNSGVTGTIGSVITGTGGLGYNGSGSTLVLAAANTFSGTITTGSNTTLGVGANNALGSITATVALGTGSTIQAVNAGGFSLQNEFGPATTFGGSHNLTFAGTGAGLSPAFGITMYSNSPEVLTNIGTTTLTGSFLLDTGTSGVNNGTAFFNVGSGTNLVVTGQIYDNAAGDVTSAQTGNALLLTYSSFSNNVTFAANEGYGTSTTTTPRGTQLSSSGFNNILTVGAAGLATGTTITPFSTTVINDNSSAGVSFQAASAGEILNTPITFGSSTSNASQTNSFTLGFTGSNALTLGGVITLGSTDFFANSATAGTTLTFSNTLALGTSTFELFGSGNNTFSSTSSFTGTGPLNIASTGTTTLLGTDARTGTASTSGFNGGTVVLDYSSTSAGATSRLSTTATGAAALTLSGVNVQLSGGTFAQTLAGNTTLNAGQSTITQTNSGTSTLALGTITRATGSAIDFGYTTATAASTALESSANTNGILGAYATVNGTDWAVGATTAGTSTAVTPYASYTAFAGGTGGTSTANYLESTANSSAATTTGAFAANSLKVDGTQALTLGGALTLTSGGILATGTGANSITGSSITTTAADLVVQQYGSGGLTIGSTITGTEALTKAGTGALTLSGTNTYTGGTFVDGGTLTIGAIANINATSGALTLNGGTLETTASFSFVSGRGVTLGTNGGTFQVDTGATFTVASVITSTNPAGDLYGGLTKTGAGTLLLSGANTFTGPINVTAGTLQLGSATALGVSSVSRDATIAPVTVGGGILDINGQTSSVGNVTLTSGSIVDSAGTAGRLGAYSFNLQSGTVSAVMTNLGQASTTPTAVTKSGTGTVTITGANLYTGNTNINAGTLLVANTTGSATGTGTVMVNSGGTLMGTGFISNAANTAVGANVVVGGGGTITPGSAVGAGMLTVTSNVFFTGTAGSLSTLALTLTGNTSTILAITGNLDLSTVYDKISFTTTGSRTASSIELASYTGTLTGTFDNVTNLPSGYSLDYGTVTAGEITLDTTAVPEPGTWAGALLCVGAVGWNQRRRVGGWLTHQPVEA